LSRFFVLIILSFLAGCTRTEYANNTYPVSGRVQTSDGTPASDVRVTLHSSKIIAEGDPFRPSGMTGDDGIFQLTTYETHDGAPVGSYAITFRWAEPQKTLFDPIPKDRLRNRFALPTEKSLTCEVRNAESQDLGTFEVDPKKLTIERVNP
jgi:hypothetical protein